MIKDQSSLHMIFHSGITEIGNGMSLTRSLLATLNTGMIYEKASGIDQKYEPKT